MNICNSRDLTSVAAKIVQINVWEGRHLASLLQFLAEENPDVLCAQEVVTAPDGMEIATNHEVHKLLYSLFAYQYFSPTVVYNLDGDMVTMGNAIYSVWPIENAQTVFTYGQGVHVETVDEFDYNIRNIQVCQLRVEPNKMITIANYHGYHEPNSHGSDKSVQTMQRAADVLQDVSGPMIVCGDFNVNPQSPAMRPFDSLKLRNLTVESGLKTTLSRASHVRVPVICDYILTSEDIVVNDFTVSDKLVSDHKAQILTFSV